MQYKSSPEITKKYIDAADAWMKKNVQIHGFNRWNDTKFSARTAVAECLANQDGCTIYEVPKN